MQTIYTLVSNKKILLALALGLIVLVIALLILSFNKKYALYVIAEPEGTKITIEKETKESPAKFNLRKGIYQIKLEKEGYASREDEAVVEKNMTIEYELIIKEDIPVNLTEANFRVLLKELPIKESSFTLSEIKGGVFISISEGPADQSKAAALSYLQKRGIDPTEIEIIWSVPAHLR